MTDELTGLTITETGTEAGVAAHLARAAEPADTVTISDRETRDHHQLVVGYGPDGSKVLASFDLERLAPAPHDAAAEVRVHTPDALVAYTDRHAHPACTTLWGDIDAGTIVTVINDHANPSDPGWGDHRATLQLQRTPEWKAWAALDSKWLSQVELAEFLEEHRLEVIEPDGSTLLEVTQTFHATTGAVFKSAQQIQSGEQRLVYEETVDASAGRNQQTEIPTDLTVVLRPWLGVDPVRVSGKFRFRVRDGGLLLGIRLLNLDDVSRTAVSDALAKVADELTLTAIEGVAPEPRR